MVFPFVAYKLKFMFFMMEYNDLKPRVEEDIVRRYAVNVVSFFAQVLFCFEHIARFNDIVYISMQCCC